MELTQIFDAAEELLQFPGPVFEEIVVIQGGFYNEEVLVEFVAMIFSVRGDDHDSPRFLIHFDGMLLIIFIFEVTEPAHRRWEILADPQSL